MKYLILAEICLTVGAPDWVVIFCWVFFGLDVIDAIIAIIDTLVKRYKNSN